MAEFLSQWRLERDSSAFVPGQPKVSWILCPQSPPVDPQVQAWTREALASQSYPHVEVLEEVDSTAETFAQSANRAAERASGEWIGFLPAGTVPSPCASFQLLREAVGAPSAKLVYANDAQVSPRRLQLLGWLAKPRPSWHTLIHFNYIGWSWLVRREVFLALGGFRELPPNEAVHEFLLRFFEKNQPALVSHSTLFYRFQEATVRYGAGFRQALGEHLQRQGLEAALTWDSDGRLDRVQIQPRVASVPQVSVVTCFRDKSDWTLRCLDALERQEGVDLDIVLVDNQSMPKERARIEERIQTFRHPIRLVSHDGPFHFARMNNVAVRDHARHPLIFLLNNDVYLKTDDAIFQTAVWAAQPQVGTVGIRLCYPDGRVQHEGIRATAGEVGRMARVGHFPRLDPFSSLTREVFANTFAACCLRREVFDAAGGLCELNWVNGFGDVAFQLGCLERGYRHIYLGGVTGVHQESGSRGQSYEYWEEMTLESRFPEVLKRMVREDLAWHGVEGGAQQFARAWRNSAVGLVRATSPALLSSIKTALNHLRSRVKIRADELD